MTAGDVDAIRTEGGLNGIRDIDEHLATIFRLVEATTGHDFSGYKRDTVVRRIQRRLSVTGAPDLGSYAGVLREQPDEAVALSHEILIGVTSFFRDAEAFDILAREVIAPLFADAATEDPVRVWDACCSTGEEVYTLAILLHEAMTKSGSRRKVQIFATDLDKRAIAQARTGFFSEMTLAHVGQERRDRYFTHTDGRWQVAKFLREMIVFANHDVLKDPPFSRLDLILCRNFLIYLKADMQKRLVLLFHQALRTGGVLFLGNSETAADADLFAPLNRKWKLYRRLQSERRPEMVHSFLPYVPLTPLPGRRADRLPAAPAEPSYQFDKTVLERHAPPCVVVNERFELLYNSTTRNPYLRLPVGTPTSDILRLVCEDLRPPLRAAIHKVLSDGSDVVFRNLRATVEGEETGVDLVVEAVPAVEGRQVMVVFRPAPAPKPLAIPEGGAAADGDVSKDLLIRQLEEQLRSMHDELVSTVEQLETSNDGLMSTNEELMSINEEFQSTNEELQSTNEELETSKEELQALNEELGTVNAELQVKVEELDRANADVENLLNSTEIATIFLDRDFRIRRFTPAMAVLFHLIPADLGRPFGHVAHKLEWDALEKTAREVLDSLQPFEQEFEFRENSRHYLLRILPYRTKEGGISGVVLALIDINDRKEADRLTRHLASFPQLNPNPVLEFTFSGDVVFYNPATLRILKECDLDEESVTLFLPTDIEKIVTAWDRRSETSILRECEIGGRFFGTSVFLSPAIEVIRIYGYEITEIRKTQDALRWEEERRRLAFEAAALGCWDVDVATGSIYCDKRCREMLGLPVDGAVTHADIMAGLHPDDLSVIEKAAVSASAGEGPGTFDHEFRVIWPDGSIHWIGAHGRVHFQEEDGHRRAVRFVGINAEITRRKRVQERLDVLAGTADLLLRSESPQQVVEDLCRTVMKYLDCQVFFNFLSNADEQKLYLNAALGISQEEAERISILEYGVAVCGCVASQGERIISENIDLSSDERTALVRSYGIRAYACHPLLMQGRVLGTLSFGTTSRGTFTDEDLSLMKTVADQVAIAMARKESETALMQAEAQATTEKNLLKAIMSALPVGVSILDAGGGMIECNEAFKEVWGGAPPTTRSVDDYARYEAWWPDGRPVAPDEWASAVAVRAGEPVVGQCLRLRKFDGTTGFVINSSAPIFDAVGNIAGCVVAIMDISAMKRAEEIIGNRNAILAGINRILGAALTASDDEDLGETCLAVAEEITGSRFGFIGEIGSDGLLHDIALSNPGWELCSMTDKRGHRRPPGNFRVHGLYGRVLSDGRGFFTNEPTSHPDRIGLPEGHPPLERFLGVPLIEDGRTIGLIALANRDDDYGDDQLHALEAIAPAIVQAFLRIRAERALRVAKESLEATVAARTSALADTVAQLTEEMEQRRQAEEVIRKNESLLQTVLETLPVGVALLDRTGKITYFNPAALSIWEGIEKTGPIESEKFAVFRHDTGEPVPVSDRPASIVFATGNPVLGQLFDIETFNGVRKTIMASSVPIKDAGGEVRGAVSVMEDITAQQELQRQLYHSQRIESVGSLAGGIAHDFNNLLMAISGYSEYVHDELPESPDLRQALSHVLAACVKARELTQKLLTFSRQQVIEMKQVNVSEVVEGAVRFLDRVLPETIHVHLDVTPKLFVLGDISQVEQVVTNIIINARDAMPDGGDLSVAVREAELPEDEVLAKGLSKPGPYVVIDIADTGCGIPAPLLDRVFEPFFTTKETGKGTGLGLSIAYGIARQHGGGVTVESRVGEGALFSLYLPLFRSVVEEAEPSDKRPAPRGQETVLVVEDDRVVREYLRIALHKAGYTVIDVEDGVAGLEMAAANDIHVVISDVIMPRKNGMELYTELRQLKPEIKVVFMSGYASDVVTEHLTADAPAVFLQKPVTRDVLLTTLRNVLDKG